MSTMSEVTPDAQARGRAGGAGEEGAAAPAAPATPGGPAVPADGPAGSPAEAPAPTGDARQALSLALPIMAGYVVLGLPCGILGVASGMEVWMVALLSVVLYSGAGQYMIPNMWLAGNPVSAIVASVGLVNTRQMLYGATLSQFCAAESRPLTFLFGATVTDESFGVNYARFVEGGWDARRALFVNLFSQLSWVAANTAGAVLGEAVQVPTALASFAMTSLFICLLCMQDRAGGNVVAALGALAGVVLCKCAGLSGVAILAGALVGVAAAMAYGALHPRSTGGNGAAPAPEAAPAADVERGR